MLTPTPTPELCSAFIWGCPGLLECQGGARTCHYHQPHHRPLHHHVIIPVAIIIKKCKEFPSLEGISGQRQASSLHT